ncbi:MULTISPECIES: lysophospholipid acyltransferase family protein [Arsenicicoccus]|uniref:lysophospholipid acyltransferase family protein n=1 Tax=Arsenicicoccus TaxID=267408 RepID=UPI000563615B|nr:MULTISPECIES: lysophospholipid acyltransferase family protein [Arsenicicoccus]
MGRSPRVRLPWAYRVCVAIAKSGVVPLTRRDWRGAEHLDRPGGVVVCCNHVSHLDFIMLAHFLYDNGRPPFFLAKDAAFRVPFFGRLIGQAGQIPVYRNTGRAIEAYRAAITAIQQGKTVPIYPEGTITRDPRMWPMTGKTGAARIALETGCPVIPVAQWGVQELLAPYSGKLRPFPRKTMRVLAGPPVDLSDLQGRPVTGEVVREATDRIMRDVIGLLEQLRGETAPPTRYDMRRHGESE